MQVSILRDAHSPKFHARKMADRVSGKIVSGDPAVPQEATEFWTFTRRVGGAPGDWTLSEIQQS